MKPRQHKESASFAAAFKGLYVLITSERHVIVHVIIMALVIIAGFILNISNIEWLVLCLTFGLVICFEAINTAIEKLCDTLHPDYNPSIGKVKDIAAGAVLFAAILAVVIGCIIFIPKIL